VSADSFRLFPFQEEAAERLRDAALDWVAYAAKNGAPRYGATRIPFLGQLRAVTGSGKTPILADVVGGMGDAVVLWTTRSSAVVEQTFTNLTSRYRSLLPPNTQILRDIPSQVVWRDLIDRSSGLTIWVLTVASWNEADAAADDSEARLRLRREQPDWAGEGSPWSQLQEKLKRPLWIVSDESHNQSTVQLDQLSALRPKAFFMASATPVVNDLFSKWSEALNAEEETRELMRRAQVPVVTRDVVDANLLKTTIELIDYRSGAEESLDGTLDALKQVEDAADSEGAGITPRAIYVVEKSNPPRGSKEDARPVAIWKHLRSRGVPANEIAIFTDTKELPEDAIKITSLSKLSPSFRHIIFNQTLQEGWDDPEAYVCYFDGVTKSFIRIRQIVGRVLRQPSARRFASEALNTATLILQTPADSYEAVVAELRAELRLYAPENEPAFSAVRLKTRSEPLDPIPAKKAARSKLKLQRYALKAPAMTQVEKALKSTAQRPWSEDDLLAPGTGRKATLELEDGSEEFEYIDVLRSARTLNAAFLRQRILQRNRPCLNAIHPDWLKGPAFEQMSCHGSQAQDDLLRLAAEVVEYFEDRVGYQPDPDPDRHEWVVGEYQPRGKDMIDFDRAAHDSYSAADFNTDERAFARSLDRVLGVVWARNPTTSATGYGIPLPKKVGDSSTFYPDFIAAKKAVIWAIDTTGRHLLDEKVRGKLIALGTPRLALVVRGEVDLGSGAREGKSGWSLLIARANLKPLLEHSDDLDDLLKVLFSAEA
jgi:type III restriction enzyme